LNNDDNSTVQALVIANIVDEILRKYGAAYNIDYDLTNMSNMEMSNTASMSEHVGKKHFDIIGIIGTKGSELVDIADYQSAQALSVEANKIFEVILKPAAQVDNHNNNNSIAAVSKIKNSLVELNNLLNNKASPQDLMKIVHMQIHPGLQLAYNLQSKIK
jgi:hypothetical protein